MEQLQIKADWFRKQGRLQDQDLEEIISKINADEEFKDGEENVKAERALKDKSFWWRILYIQIILSTHCYDGYHYQFKQYSLWWQRADRLWEYWWCD